MDNNENFTTETVDVVETNTNAGNSGKSTNATAILVLGILSILCCAPCGIVSLIMYLTGKNNILPEKAGMAKAGFICSIIGIVLWIVGIIYYSVVGVNLAAAYGM